MKIQIWAQLKLCTSFSAIMSLILTAAKTTKSITNKEASGTIFSIIMHGTLSWFKTAIKKANSKINHLEEFRALLSMMKTHHKLIEYRIQLQESGKMFIDQLITRRNVNWRSNRRQSKSRLKEKLKKEKNKRWKNNKKMSDWKVN